MHAPAGWYDDPWSQAPWRWWDGQQWKGHTSVETAPSPIAGATAASVPRRVVWEHLIGRDGRIAVTDVETTGLYNVDRIVEVAILTLDCEGNICDQFETMIQPLRDVGATWIHGLEAGMLRDAPTFADVAQHVAARIDGAVVAGVRQPGQIFAGAPTGTTWPVQGRNPVMLSSSTMVNGSAEN
jgi:DNA polymerase-3 subunit epsilon